MPDKHLLDMKKMFPSRPFQGNGMPQHIDWPEYKRGTKLAKSALKPGTSCAETLKSFSSILNLPKYSKKERLSKYLTVMGFNEEIFDKNLGTWDGLFDNTWQNFLNDWTDYELVAEMFKVLWERRRASSKF